MWFLQMPPGQAIVAGATPNEKQNGKKTQRICVNRDAAMQQPGT
jgi:hypothetical protein